MDPAAETMNEADRPRVRVHERLPPTIDFETSVKIIPSPQPSPSNSKKVNLFSPASIIRTTSIEEMIEPSPPKTQGKIQRIKTFHWGEIVNTTMETKKSIGESFPLTPTIGNGHFHWGDQATQAVFSTEDLTNLSKKERDALRKKIFQEQRHTTTVSMICVLISLVTHIIEEEVRYANITNVFDAWSDPWVVNPSIASICVVFHIIISASTCVLVFTIYRYYRAKYADRIIMKRVNIEERYFGSTLFMSMVLEMGFNAIHVPPNVFSTFQLQCVDLRYIPYSYRIINMIFFLRLTLVYRWLRLHSRTHNQTAQSLSALYDLENSKLITIKDLLYKNSVPFVMALYLGTMSIGAYIIMVFERPVDHNENSYPITDYSICFWYIWVVMTTIGLGDWIPLSTPARATSVVMSMVGMILTALLISTVSKGLEVTKLEEKLLTTLTRVELRQSVNVVAANTISAWWRYKHYPQFQRAYLPRYCSQLRSWNSFRKNFQSAMKQDKDASDMMQEILGMIESLNGKIDTLQMDSAKLRGSNLALRKNASEINLNSTVMDKLMSLQEQQVRTLEVVASLERKVSQMDALRKGVLGPFMAT